MKFAARRNASIPKFQFYNNALMEILVIGEGGLPIEEFLTMDLRKLF